MNFFAAANARSIVIIRVDSSGKPSHPTTFARTLKKHPLSKGVTRTQAAIDLLEWLSMTHLEADQKTWRKLPRVLDREPEIAGILFNDPPSDYPIAHYEIHSLDSCSVELWLRNVFGVYRKHLPPIIFSLPQDYQTWTTHRWYQETPIPSHLSKQVEAAIETHEAIKMAVEHRSRQQQTQVLQATQAEAARMMAENLARLSSGV